MSRISLLRSRIFRIALAHLCLFGAAVAVLVGGIYWATVESVTRQIDATIDAEIRGLAEQYQQRGAPGLIRALRRRSAGAAGTGGLYLLTDGSYVPLAGNLDRWPDETPAADGWLTFRLAFPEAEGGGLNFGRARVFDLGGGLNLLVGHDIRERTRIAALVRDSLAWGIAAAVLFSLVAGALMSRSLLRRIEAINRTSEEIMAGHLRRRVPVTGRGDEFDQLAGQLNAMLDRIESLLEGMRQVTDNIAHDLRSPLARMRSRLEVTLLQAPGEAGYREAIRTSIDEADGLLRTFNALLSIARAEAGTARRSFAPLDLGTLVADVTELYEPVAEARGIALAAALDASLGIQGDRDLLFQAVANGLDNAIKFSPDDGEVRVTLSRERDRAVIAIADRGPGIPAGERDRVLERFYRLEESRSTPGSGLGLSLVNAVAKLHGGRLTLLDNDPGLHLRLALPLSRPADDPTQLTGLRSPPPSGRERPGPDER